MSTNVPVIYVGQIGASIRPHCVDKNGTAVDISDATSMTMHLKSPTEVEKSFTAVLVTDGEDGYCEYVTTSASDLDEDGWWWAQVEIVTPTKRFPPLKYRFPVLEKIF